MSDRLIPRSRAESKIVGPATRSCLLVGSVFAGVFSGPAWASSKRGELDWDDVATELRRNDVARKPSSEPPGVVEPESEEDLGAEVVPAAFDEPESPEPSSVTESLVRTLSFGGAYLQQASISALHDGQDFSFGYSPPGLVDLFLNATPTEHVRGYLLLRLGFDPSAESEELLQLMVDQLSLRFDLDHQVFFTLGRQQVIWGPGMIWTPTDFLRPPNLTPLEAFDLRTGTDMFRVQVPLSGIRTNVTAAAFMVRTAEVPEAEEETRFGAAFRVEVELPRGELGASAVFLQQRRPRYGLDLAIGLGDVDFYSAIAMQRDTERRLWRRTEAGFEPRALSSPAFQVMAGATTQWRLWDVYQLGLRLEGFWNELGYVDSEELTWLVANGDHEPLRSGRLYGVTQLSLTRRSAHEPTLQVSIMGNILQRSFFTRVEASTVVVMAFRLGVFFEAPIGPAGSEFRFQTDSGAISAARLGAYGRVQF